VVLLWQFAVCFSPDETFSWLYCDVCVCGDICHQVLDLYSKTPHSHKDMELAAATSSRAHAAVASGDDSQSRLTPRTPQTPKSVS